MRSSLAVIVTAGMLLVTPFPARADSPPSSPKHPQLTNAAPSIDALLDQFLRALAAKDEQAMHRLRVSEVEYRQIIIPGTVKPGEAPRQVAESPSAFFWSMINQKSEDVGRLLMANYGGHTYKRKALTYTKGSRDFAWYRAHGDVRLQLEDETGATKELHTGSIAEIDGQYKFIGFNTNN